MKLSLPQIKRKLDLQATGDKNGARGSPHYLTIDKPLLCYVQGRPIEGLTATSHEGVWPAEVRRRPASMQKKVVKARCLLSVCSREGERNKKGLDHSHTR